jgi:hypothetical protein
LGGHFGEKKMSEEIKSIPENPKFLVWKRAQAKQAREWADVAARQAEEQLEETLAGEDTLPNLFLELKKRTDDFKTLNGEYPRAPALVVNNHSGDVQEYMHNDLSKFDSAKSALLERNFSKKGFSKPQSGGLNFIRRVVGGPSYRTVFPCAFLTRTVALGSDGKISEADFKQFASLLDWLIDNKILLPAFLSPPSSVKMANGTAQLFCFCYPLMHKNRLNIILGGNYFKCEGEVSEEVENWPMIDIPPLVLPWEFKFCTEEREPLSPEMAKFKEMYLARKSIF